MAIHEDIGVDKDNIIFMLANDCKKTIIVPTYFERNELFAALARLVKKQVDFNFVLLKFDLSYSALRLLTDDYNDDHMNHGAVEIVVFLESVYNGNRTLRGKLDRIVNFTLAQVHDVDELVNLLQVDCASFKEKVREWGRRTKTASLYILANHAQKRPIKNVLQTHHQDEWPVIGPVYFELAKALELKPSTDPQYIALYKDATCDYLDTYLPNWRDSPIQVLCSAIFARNTRLICDLFDQLTKAEFILFTNHCTSTGVINLICCCLAEIDLPDLYKDIVHALNSIKQA